MGGDPLQEVFDVEAQQKEISRVRELIPGIKILKGIEVGVNRKQPITKTENSK